jgi:hypothetical protein
MLKNKRRLLAAASLVFSLLLPSLAAQAAQLNQGSISLSRLAASATPSSIYVTIKFNTTAGVVKAALCFPNTKSDGTGTGFTVTNGTPTVVTTGAPNTPSGTTALPGTLTAASGNAAAAGTIAACPSGAAGSIIISGITAPNNTSLYEFTVNTPNVTNPTVVSQYNTSLASLTTTPTVVDTDTTPTYITTASNGDQVTVTGTVSPNFTFSLSSATDVIPAVDTTTISTSNGPAGNNPVFMTVATNSPLGYTAYVKSQNNQLTSTLHPGTPITTGTFDGTPDTITAGTTRYGFVPSTGTACSTCIGVPAYDSEYAVADGTHAGSFAASGAFASFVSHANYTSGDQIYLKERDAVSAAVAQSNDYTDVLTIVAAGNF